MSNSMLAELAGHRGFVCYRLARLPSGKADKLPFDPATGYNCDAQNPAYWLLPAEAEAGAARWAQTYTDGVGVGIVIYEGSGLFCIDIDGCIDEAGNLSALAADLIARFPGAPVEISASGKGLHIFGGHDRTLGEHKSKNTAHHVELYTRARFIALTGNYLIPGRILTNHSAALSALAAEYFPRDASTGSLDWKDGPAPDWNFYTDDAELIAWAMTHKSPAQQLGGRCPFEALWTANADLLARFYPANPNSASGNLYDASSCDQALANHLAWLTGNDCNRVLALMEQSALRRDKWEARPDYLRTTIAGACSTARKWPKLPKAPPASSAVPAAPPDPPATEAPTTSAVPLAPDAMPDGSELPPRGGMLFTHDQTRHFLPYTYVEDIYQAMGPDGKLLDPKHFDVRFGGRQFQMALDGSGPTESAWKAFTMGLVQHRQVRGLVFDPREEPDSVVMRNGLRYLNTWRPLNIKSRPGDVSLFRAHIDKLLPPATHGDDAQILLSYLKFMVQHKGTKASWFPFIQGTEGNGKSFINTVMEYCLGEPYTHKPRPAELESRFNSKFYGCLFVAIDDMQVSEARAVWERLKPMVTETRMEIESKGVDAAVREVCFNIIATSNYKNGVPITESGRRVAPFFCAQQTKADLARDGMGSAYFTRLWALDMPAVLYWLEHEPIDARYNPAMLATTAPATSSTREGVNEALGYVEQEILERISIGADGFAGGWISGTSLDHLISTASRSPVNRNRRRDMVLALGYQPHPGLPDGGRVLNPLPDGTRPRLYICKDHPAAHLTDAATIRAAFLAAQPKPTA